jgi:hypothetical protein
MSGSLGSFEIVMDYAGVSLNESEFECFTQTVEVFKPLLVHMGRSDHDIPNRVRFDPEINSIVMFWDTYDSESTIELRRSGQIVIFEYELGSLKFYSNYSSFDELLENVGKVPEPPPGLFLPV